MNPVIFTQCQANPQGCARVNPQSKTVSVFGFLPVPSPNCLGRFAAHLLLCIAAIQPDTQAGEAAAEAFRPIVYATEQAKKILQCDAQGKVVWEYPAEMARDVWQLPNGNVLFCYNDQYNSKSNNNPSGVLEVTVAKAVIFHFKSTGQVWSCQRMADGQTLVGAASQGKLLIVNPTGTVTREIRLKSPGGHSCIRNARALANGHFLVAEEGAKTVREYDLESKIVWEKTVEFPVYSAIRQPNGNTLICGKTAILEMDPDGLVQWKIQAQDIPEIGVRWFAGMQQLPDGGIFVCNAGGKVPFVEFGPDHRVRWRAPAGLTFPMGHGIQRLDIRGAPLK